MENKETKIQEFLNLICQNGDSGKYIEDQRGLFEKIKSDPLFQKKLKEHYALSHELRFAIYELLERNELCTCALAAIVQMSEPTITHHLKILIDADLLIAQKQGLYTIYYTKENFRKKKYP